MFGTLKGRLLVILGVAAIAVIALWQNGIKLGLDLRGGMHLALEVQDPNGTLTDEQRADYTNQNLEILRNRINQFGVAEPLIQKVGQDRIIVELPGITDEERAKNIIEQQAFLEWKLVMPSAELLEAIPRMDRLIAQQLGPEGLEESEPATEDSASAATQQDVRELLFGTTDTVADSVAGDTAATSATAAQPLSRRRVRGRGVRSGAGEALPRAAGRDRRAAARNRAALGRGALRRRRPGALSGALFPPGTPVHHG
jgi:preprotein translocase subunit SecD